MQKNQENGQIFRIFDIDRDTHLFFLNQMKQKKNTVWITFLKENYVQHFEINSKKPLKMIDFCIEEREINVDI